MLNRGNRRLVVSLQLKPLATRLISLKVNLDEVRTHNKELAIGYIYQRFIKKEAEGSQQTSTKPFRFCSSLRPGFETNHRRDP